MLKRTLYFATTSNVKFDQYAFIFKDFGFDIERATTVASALTEPQYDPSRPDADESMVNHPLRQIARFAEKWGQIPYMIEDTSLVVDALSKKKAGASGLPGADTKSWWRNLGAEGLLRLLENETARSATFYCQIGVYLGRGHYDFARSELRGRIALDARQGEIALRNIPRTNPFFFHSIFEPDGYESTIAELDVETFCEVDYRRKCAANIADRLVKVAIEESRQIQLFNDR